MTGHSFLKSRIARDTPEKLEAEALGFIDIWVLFQTTVRRV